MSALWVPLALFSVLPGLTAGQGSAPPNRARGEQRSIGDFFKDNEVTRERHWFCIRSDGIHIRNERAGEDPPPGEAAERSRDPGVGPRSG